jgi:hypothetical protein
MSAIGDNAFTDPWWQDLRTHARDCDDCRRAISDGGRWCKVGQQLYNVGVSVCLLAMEARYADEGQ